MSDLFPRAVRATFGRLVPLAFRTRIVGAERIPVDGALLAGNHVSYLDPVLLWCMSPRPVHFMAKSELFGKGFIGWLLPRLWAFPVNRGEPDRTAIVTASELLRSGELVGVFPEGSRRGAETDAAVGAAHGGAAFIALRAGVPIVPIAFVGTDRAMPRGASLPRLVRVTIHVGEPIDLARIAPDAGRKERVAAVTQRMMEEIGALLRSAVGGTR
ncbi:MAG: 1-acyl-sn-glycerol-3-phosphate acyltransferase [Coriobacteriia bacterium]|nr:1-acyl-sn-glycerol-3-phosphate acyltransferase [Coriobacteriia bacterium]